MKGKRLSFAFISFCESGLFNGLQRIQMKKIISSQALLSGSLSGFCARSPKPFCLFLVELDQIPRIRNLITCAR
jgi:hypothetical protein